MISPIECTKYLIGSDTKWITAGDDTQYYLEDYSGLGDYVIVFLGSDSAADWKNNFRFWKVPYKEMKTKFYIHAGFLKCWKLIEDEVIGKLRECNFNSITVTGHSYGGALATLCKEAIWFHFPEKRNVTRLITFGSPRVIGTYNWKKIKERWDNSLLLANGSDMVTKIPFASMFYKHVSAITHIGDLPKLHKYFDFSYHEVYKYRDTLQKLIQ